VVAGVGLGAYGKNIDALALFYNTMTKQDLFLTISIHIPCLLLAALSHFRQWQKKL
jgi:hypothetical protein